jgi:predicted ATPase/DNA-binding winged helix-turn-helix (wHTH) protein
MIYAFGDCALDTRLYTVQRAGQSLRLRPKVFQVLCYLPEHRDRVISRQELCEHVWPDQFISDATLGSTLRAVRQALGDTGRTQQMIQTVHRHGYRFVATVEEGPAPAPAPSAGVTEAAPGGELHGEALRPSPETSLQLLSVGGLAGERKLVTVLCGVVVPAAPGGTLPATRPQALATVAQEVMAQYGGTLLPMVDEVLLAVFGLPVAHEDHAQRAVLAALRLQQALAAPAAGSGTEGLVRLGVHTGAVAVGDLAEGTLATVVVGAPLTQAVALQACAAPGTILCSATTARLVQGLVRLAAVAGPPSPGAVYQVRGLRPARVSGSQGCPRPVSPFVGRARELGEQLLHLAQRVQAPALLLVAHRVLGQTLAFLGEFSTAQGHLERGLTLYDPEQHRAFASLYGQDQGVICRSWAALTLWSLGYPDQALRHSRAALTLAQELAHPFSLAYAMCFAGMLCQLRRDVQAAQERATAEVALCTAQGFALYLARGTLLQGWAMAEQAQGAAGLAQMRQGLVAYHATGAVVFRPYYLAFLAEAYGRVGQAGEGLTLLGEALGAVHRTGERFYQAELYRLKGELLLVRSAEHHREAEACLHQALLVARHQRAKSSELRAAMSLSRLWQQQGKRTEARQLLAEVYSWFTEGFDTADLQAARALLEESRFP